MRTARRKKWLEVEPIDATRARFLLGLEDTSPSDTGVETIHALEIAGVLSIPGLEILEIEPRAILHPYPECAVSLDPVRQMVGARIGAGFRARVLDVMGRTRGCTHFMSLMLDLTAAHTLTTFLRMRERAEYETRKAPDDDWTRTGLALVPELENACIALRADSPVIRNARRPLTDGS